MTGTASDPFFWSDWQGAADLRLCSMGARGLWMYMLCIAAESKPKGYVLIRGKNPSVEQFAQVVGAAPQDVKIWIDELENAGVFSRTRANVIYCRRMVRVEKKREASKKGGKIGGRVTHDKQKGIFDTQGITQEGTQGGTQHPRRAPLPSPSPSPSPNQVDKTSNLEDHAPKKARAAKRRTALPEILFQNPELEEAARQFWGTHGRFDLTTPEAMADQIAQFQDHHRKTGATMADWPAAWRTWYRNALKFNKKVNGNGSGRHPERLPTAHDRHLAGLASLLSTAKNTS